MKIYQYDRVTKCASRKPRRAKLKFFQQSKAPVVLLLMILALALMAFWLAWSVWRWLVLPIL